MHYRETFSNTNDVLWYPYHKCLPAKEHAVFVHDVCHGQILLHRRPDANKDPNADQDGENLETMAIEFEVLRTTHEWDVLKETSPANSETTNHWRLVPSLVLS